MSIVFFSKAIWNNIIADTYILLLYLSLMEKKLELCCDLPELVLLIFLLPNQEIDA
jgi:hypothetical protein